MDTTNGRRGVREGMLVRDAHGDELGKVSVCGEEHFLIERRPHLLHLLKEDLVARYDEVASTSGTDVRLTIGGERAWQALAFRAEHLREGANRDRVPLGEAGLHLHRPDIDMGVTAMETGRKVMDCSRSPNLVGCTLRISGREDEVVRAAEDHAVTVHGDKPGAELHELIVRSLEDELPGDRGEHLPA